VNTVHTAPLRCRGLRQTAACMLYVCALSATGAALAGDDRSLSFFHTHTGESATITFSRDGVYDERALAQLNWLLRDWRVGEAAKMDPQIFDILWEIYRSVGSREAIHVISAYRSPATNGMLRQASSGVAENSQHMSGKAIDIRLPDVDTARLREAAMRLQYGGVGFYPSSNFVHVDTGSVRAWPRMSQEQLARLFPDGKTVHLPPSGKPLARYEEARAEVLQRQGVSPAAAPSGNPIGTFFAGLLRQDAPTTAASGPVPAEPGAKARSALAFAPLPPRRPDDPTLPSGLPGREDIAQADARESGQDDVRVLFRPVATRFGVAPRAPITLARVQSRPATTDPIDFQAPSLQVGFSAQFESSLSVARFTGPAVQPLPTPQLANAEH
jgi:uncharacterized protein YcbK (DUF882 family)